MCWNCSKGASCTSSVLLRSGAPVDKLKHDCRHRQALADRPIVVVSAMGKTTNALLSAAKTAVETGEVDISNIRSACFSAEGVVL